MKCPACGDEEKQRSIGRITGAPHVAYHCEACDELYAALSRPEEENWAGEEEWAATTLQRTPLRPDS